MLSKFSYEDIKELQEALIDTIEDTSENLTKTIAETYFINNKAIQNINEKVLKLMNDRGMIAPFLAFSSINLLKQKIKVSLD